ncbi:uncharacterized protein [Primulina eburnea]|uniref:uncharacterized protein n=1 Tax=Primulina eburnea TaxID=1245227 RepID=UPI003C6C1ED3
MATQIPAFMLNAMAINFGSILSFGDTEVQKVFQKLEAAGMAQLSDVKASDIEEMQTILSANGQKIKVSDPKKELKHEVQLLADEGDGIGGSHCEIEDRRGQQEHRGTRASTARVNVVETSLKGKKRKFEKQPQQGQQPPNKKKFKGTCYNCGKPNHMAKDCRKPKKGNPQANVVQERSVPFDFSQLDLSAVILEANLVENTNKLWVDTGVTRHICSNKGMFSTYAPSTGRKLYMGNSATSEVVGTGNVVLKMTSGLEVTLVDALHVPEIKKNLMSGSLLVKQRFRLVFESNKVVLIKNDHFIGKRYLDESLFKLNVLAIRQSVVEKRKENGSNKRKIETAHEGQVPTHEPTLNENAIQLVSSSKVQEPKRSKMARISKSFGPNFHTFMLENEPKNIQDALASPEAPYWKETINSEMDSILQNYTWELVDLPPALHNLEIHQMDVKTIFLNGELEEEIYVEQPEGFIVK